MKRQERFLSKAYVLELVCCLQQGQVLRHWLPHLTLPQMRTDRGGTNLWLKGMNPQSARRHKSSNGKSLPLRRQIVRSPALVQERWLRLDLVVHIGIRSALGVCRQKFFSCHYDPTEQGVEEFPEHPPACTGE